MSPPVAAEPLPSHSHVLVHPVSSSSAREARSLVDAIRAHRRRDAAPAQTPAPRPASSNSSSPLYFPWRLSNKYYTASVAFRIVPSSDSEPQEDVRSHLTEGDEPAVVVVAPASASPSAAVTALLDRLSSRVPEFEVALLVTHPSPSDTPGLRDASKTDVSLGETAPPSTGSAPFEVDEAAWDDAALSAGFECVHLDAAPHTASVASETSSAEDDDEAAEHPLNRIVAALHAHMWEDMERVEAPTRTVAARAAGAIALERLNGGASGRGGDWDEGQGGQEDDDEDEEWSALGAPPLPAPRVRPEDAGDKAQWTFPERFLPSISRAAASATANGSLQSAFEDDFTPFVDAASSTASFDDGVNGTRVGAPHDGDALADALVLSTGDLSPCRHPSLAFPDSTSRSAKLVHPLLTDEPSDGDLDSLDELFSRLSTARTATSSMGFQERRAYAERVVRELLGDDALAGLDDSDAEDVVE